MANFGLRDMPVERDTALKLCMNASINIEMHLKMIAAVTSTGSAKVRAPGVGYFYALTPVYLANRLGAFGCRADHPDGELFLPGTLPMGLPF